MSGELLGEKLRKYREASLKQEASVRGLAASRYQSSIARRSCSAAIGVIIYV